MYGLRSFRALLRLFTGTDLEVFEGFEDSGLRALGSTCIMTVRSIHFL